MNRYEILQQQLKPKAYKRIIGVTQKTLRKMIEVYNNYTKEKRVKQEIRGRRSVLSNEERVLVMLEYYRDYRTLRHIGLGYEVSESTVLRAIKEVEGALLSSGQFSLPSKRALCKEEIDIEYIVVDSTECEIQRPKKAEGYYSGKRRRHSVKAQIVISGSGEIISTDIDKGSVHDYKLFKKSRLPIKDNTCIRADLGYIGIKSKYS